MRAVRVPIQDARHRGTVAPWNRGTVEPWREAEEQGRPPGRFNPPVPLQRWVSTVQSRWEAPETGSLALLTTVLQALEDDCKTELCRER